MASATASTEAIRIEYPPELNGNDRKAYKDNLLRESPETLFADLFTSGEVSNLIFFTDNQSAWVTAIRAHYPYVIESRINDAVQLKFGEVEDPGTVMTTVNVFDTGKVVVQGSNLQLFEHDFLLIKEQAQPNPRNDF
ncbi:hypothetical protein KUCAC02_037099 [Chaenocephalus aceratus]|nr:hypothetical protein KUCAC02_037099 [Chaenocephalus aceratus]